MAETEFCLLGPLIVRRGGTIVPVRQGKLRVVLAALLLSANRVVSVDDLAKALWGPGAAPPSARVTVANYVKRLRDTLECGPPRISTRSPGYLITVQAGELDVAWFEYLLAAARAAAR
jgi:DNA-binding SARP family transcriptional activator